MAQVEDRVAQLGDHAGHLLAQLADLLPAGQGRSSVGREVVHQVAERGDVLGHAVVDLAGDPLALLAHRVVAHPPEQQRGLQLHGVPCRGGRAGRGPRPSRCVCRVSRARTAIISSLAISGMATWRSRSIIASYSQHLAESASAQRHRSRAGCRRSSAAGPSHRWPSGRTHRRYGWAHAVGLVHDLLGDADGVEPTAELARERLAAAGSGPTALRYERIRVGAADAPVAGRRPSCPTPDAGGQPGEAHWRRARGPSAGAPAPTATSRTPNSTSDHAHQALPATVQRRRSGPGSRGTARRCAWSGKVSTVRCRDHALPRRAATVVSESRPVSDSTCGDGGGQRRPAGRRRGTRGRPAPRARSGRRW